MVTVMESDSKDTTSYKPLREIQAAGKLGTFLVQVHWQNLEEYTYVREGKTLQGCRLTLLLVSSEEKEYVTAKMTMWKGNKAEVEAAAARFKVGLHFLMTQVSFVANEQRQYISSPIKVVVDLRQTKLVPVLQSLHEKFVAGPPTTLADMLQLPPGRQRFDVTALVREEGAHREVTTRHGQRIAQDVILRDGSMLQSKSLLEEAAQIQTALFFTSLTEHTNFLAVLKASPILTFFGLDVNIGKTGTHVTPAFQGFHWEAAACSRAGALEADAVWGATAHVLTTEWQPTESVDYSEMQGRFSLCAFLSLHQSRDSQYIGNTLFQLNHVHVPMPPNEVKYQDRIFWTTRISDFSGAVDVAIRQKAACQLAGIRGSGDEACQEFLEQQGGNLLAWPLLASVKILVTMKDLSPAGDSESLGSSSKKVRFVIVEACEQDLKEYPSHNMLETLQVLNLFPIPHDALLVARFTELHTNSFGMFQIDAQKLTLTGGSSAASGQTGVGAPGAQWVLAEGGKRRRVNCGKALVLLRSRQKTSLERDNDKSNTSVRLITKGVQDALDVDDAYIVPHTVIAYCDERDLKDFVLDPPKTGSRVQHALALVTAKHLTENEPECVVERLQLINENDVASVRLTLRRLSSLSSASCGRDEPVMDVTWTQDEDQSLTQPLCLGLSLYPKGDTLESPAKTSSPL